MCAGAASAKEPLGGRVRERRDGEGDAHQNPLLRTHPPQSAIITYDYDTSARWRKDDPEFYGFIPEGVPGAIVFACMVRDLTVSVRDGFVVRKRKKMALALGLNYVEEITPIEKKIPDDVIGQTFELFQRWKQRYI